MKTKPIFDAKIVLFTLLIMLALVPIVALIHEYGHGLICVLDGKDFVFGITIAGGWLSCIGIIEEPTLFRLAGGMLTAIVSFGALAILKSKLGRRFKFISIALVTIGIGEYASGLMEGFLNDFYMHTKFSGIVSAMIMFTVLIILCYRETKSINEQRGQVII